MLRIRCIFHLLLVQKLDHPHIVKYFVSFVEREELNLVLELADGGDLAQLIQASCSILGGGGGRRDGGVAPCRVSGGGAS